jgi:hypothetical protein
VRYHGLGTPGLAPKPCIRIRPRLPKNSAPDAQHNEDDLGAFEHGDLKRSRKRQEVVTRSGRCRSQPALLRREGCGFVVKGMMPAKRRIDFFSQRIPKINSKPSTNICSIGGEICSSALPNRQTSNPWLARGTKRDRGSARGTDSADRENDRQSLDALHRRREKAGESRWAEVHPAAEHRCHADLGCPEGPFDVVYTTRSCVYVDLATCNPLVGSSHVRCCRSGFRQRFG